MRAKLLSIPLVAAIALALAVPALAATASWHLISGPAIAGGGGLSDVTCVGANDCWAVGFTST